MTEYGDRSTVFRLVKTVTGATFSARAEQNGNIAPVTALRSFWPSAISCVSGGTSIRCAELGITVIYQTSDPLA